MKDETKNISIDGKRQYLWNFVGDFKGAKWISYTMFFQILPAKPRIYGNYMGLSVYLSRCAHTEFSVRLFTAS